ncbi:BZ3500_MvSof-1268-A1-R1_Chr1-1g00839 [Microbotryum saponariae]|uniref:BZ3500_MvSof-1268-A1-R1_Chr1-1g00839 protein n=1 Tax=Microbotryum saponariae TaxID=289078 RepID=A0A2X0K9R9_9BASI|nr:BZ3500_MvSof-1268-A1-R1_Chr1-1g00839 [Microbotryum saponariae]SCZ92761.1 BZ3501_MvSof-1269-A2-R1_Chr1-1g00436 [Microbotryum saponariae]
MRGLILPSAHPSRRPPRARRLSLFLLPSPRRRALHFSHHLVLPTSPPFSGGYETVAFVMW